MTQKAHVIALSDCKSVREAIEKFIIDTDDLYTSVEVFPETLIDPPEYMDYCKLCNAQEREHNPTCLLYPLWVAIQ
jgi:hypothetical protein